MVAGLPRSHTHIRHGYTLNDLYDIAVRAVGSAHWIRGKNLEERVETAWTEVAIALCEAKAPPTRGELFLVALRAADQDHIDTMRHHGVDKRDAHQGPGSGEHFQRYWHRLDGSPFEDKVVDTVALGQIWPTLSRRQREMLLALATYGGYREASAAVGVSYKHFTDWVSLARRSFLQLWHEGETPTRMWGRDIRRGRENTGRNPTLLVRVRRRARAARRAAGRQGQTP
ncbi:hypothetical protein GCM10012275_55000 [Longimycelium tulufanense]|uniref:Uncharacterized protein n=2 Tax=Longimycelium tulufanense TaxID=907463 RepID=A0A8J3CJL6_9PSEU|nr:hypothetical protein GCM10012275_55000 [Longimycelium tulufanense]